MFTVATVQRDRASVRLPRSTTRPHRDRHPTVHTRPVWSPRSRMLFVAAPTVTGAAPACHAGRRPHRRRTAAPRVSPTADRDRGPHSASAARRSLCPTVHVRRYDSLWSIAERHLPGKPRRRGTATSNASTPHDRRRQHHHHRHRCSPCPPMRIALPTKTSTTVVVQARRHPVGHRRQHGIRDWTDLWDTQPRPAPNPTGDDSADPNLIEPGWTITARLPTAAAPRRSPPSHPAPRTSAHDPHTTHPSANAVRRHHQRTCPTSLPPKHRAANQQPAHPAPPRRRRTSRPTRRRDNRAQRPTKKPHRRPRTPPLRLRLV